MEPYINIIILNWNGFEMTRDCLNSLAQINYKNYKIILIDNGSHDGSVDKLKSQFTGSCLDIIALDINLGFTGGNNIGIEYCQNKYNPDYYLLLNNDTVVDKFFLKEMVDAFSIIPNCYAVVPKIYYYGDKSLIAYAGGHTYRLTGLVKQYGIKERDAAKYNSSRKITFMNGCCALLSKEAIKQLGVLDDRFFAYSEDTDYSIRILNSNHSILYAPKAIIYHKIGYSSELNKGKWFAFYLATRNIIFLQKKHLSKLLIPLFAIAFGVRWVLYLTIKLSLLRDFKSVKAIYQGITDGIMNRSRFYTIQAPTKQKVWLSNESLSSENAI